MRLHVLFLMLLELDFRGLGIKFCLPLLENRNDPFACNLHPLYEMQSHLNPQLLPIMHRHERNKSSFIYSGQHPSTYMWLDGSLSLASQSACKQAIGNFKSKKTRSMIIVVERTLTKISRVCMHVSCVNGLLFEISKKCWHPCKLIWHLSINQWVRYVEGRHCRRECAYHLTSTQPKVTTFNECLARKN